MARRPWHWRSCATGANGRIVGGRILFKDRDLLQLSPKVLRQVRGAEIAMVYQEPTTALNPSLTIGTQLRESCAITGG